MLFRQKYRDRETREWRESKFWSYEFHFGGGRIREKTGLTSKTAARDAMRERRRQLAEGSSGVRRRKPRLVRQASEEWLALKRGSLAPSSLRIEKKNLDHLLPHFGAMLTTDVEAADVARYQEKRTKEKAAAATINLELGTLRAILRRGGLWARIQPDVRMLPERDDVGRALTVEDEARLLASAAKSRSRSILPALLLALNTGLRRGELADLRWEQVDLDARRLIVGKSKTKAGSGRKVPLNERAFAALSAWAKQFPFRRPEHAVFPSEHYGQDGAVYATDPETPTGPFKEAWEGVKRATGVKDEDNPKRWKLPPVRCRWHDLRHTFCTRLLEQSQGLPILAALMGWSAATTVRMAKRYGHISGEVLSAAVGTLDAPKAAGN
jgi:integrase